ncbi:MAG TPA: hypothetical protein V6C81_11705 [Planktothrix sp.]|jgi:hypothetical protein
METVLAKTIKCTGIGAAVGLGIGIVMAVLIGIVNAVFSVLFMGAVQNSDPDFLGIIGFIIVAGAVVGFLFGIGSGVSAVNNRRKKRNKPEQEAGYKVTFSASTDTLPELIKVATEARLSKFGVVIVNSEIKSEKRGFAYSAIIQPDNSDKIGRWATVADIPGQPTKLLLRQLIQDQSASALSADCLAMVAEFVPAGPMRVDGGSFSNGEFATTIEVPANAQTVELLRSKLPAKFVTIE